MKVQFAVMEIDGREASEVKRFDTYEEALAHIETSCPADLLGTVEFFIRKVFSNRR